MHHAGYEPISQVRRDGAPSRRERTASQRGARKVYWCRYSMSVFCGRNSGMGPTPSVMGHGHASAGAD